ncbi:carbohydrate ABC transporter substrate-binding protein (CUT1 family) [Paenibacillus sp. BK033]|uniref:ABC transporter substrate-binding protein n=1 Tax=Paenibacillus sp. BK033 TaxID=2512133 RepID=UPI0010ED4E48|nr:sugar ABC transporter substrate-binding protein [Paenibacillus sp. BK033]TCN01437.1 carbohydrate ABC transporter substrate-binding protein (CUT1 family) [Paenibacillus sp. BK033]
MKGFERKKRTAIMLLAAMSLLSACSSNASAPAEGSEQTSNAGANTGQAEQVTLRVMDWSDSTKAIREEFHRKFTEKYPNIKIEYTQLTIDQFKNTILTAVKSEEAPDLFPIPTGMKLATLVKDGWFQPLDPYIDDSFKSLFIDGTFQEGTTKVDGKIYAIPESLSLPGTLLFYNKKLFQEAGLDPEKPPATYDEFREAAKKITEAGHGKYYGIIEGGKQTNRWTDAARDWSALAGSGLNSQSPISLVTKKTTYDSEAVLGLFDLFQSIAKDGSYHPKTMSLSAPEARALFAQGQAGFIIQGAWNVGVWKRDNPELDFGVAPPPVPDSRQKGALPLTSSGGWLGLSAKSEHPKEAALYLKEYYGGDFFQAKKVETGDSFSVVKGINEKYATSEQLKQYYDIANQYGRMVPDPNILNPAVSEVFAAFKDVHPSLGELLAGVVGGAISDAPKKLHQLSEQLDRAWSEAIEAAKKNGAAVDAKDFEFANWKPLENYEADDYAAAK